MDRVALRATFDEVPELYDRARPAYPPAVADAVLDLTGVGDDSRILEIGPGTGQLTVSLAGTGASVTAVELGAGLARVARRRLAAFPRACVVVAPFEEWSPPHEPFDVVVAAAAFQWLDPALRVRKALDVLRPGGVLAVVATHHVAGGTEQFFVDVQGCYERWGHATPPGLRLPRPEDLPTAQPELQADSRVVAVELRRIPWEVEFSTAEYRDLLSTSSGHRALEATRRNGLLGCVGELLETRYGGRVTQCFLTEVWAARRR